MPRNPTTFPGAASRPAWTGMQESTFMSKVLPYFGGGLLVTALGGHISFRVTQSIGFHSASMLLLGLFVLNIAMFFILTWQRQTPGLNVALYYGYTFLNGLMLGPIMVQAQLVGGSTIILQAFGLSAISFIGISIYVTQTGKDCSGMGPYLISGLLVVVGASLLNFFVGGSGLSLGISIVSVFLFLGFTAYDMSQIMHKYRDEEYMMATIQLYLDFLNLFIHILNILIRLARRD